MVGLNTFGWFGHAQAPLVSGHGVAHGELKLDERRWAELNGGGRSGKRIQRGSREAHLASGS
jgi:hypothetical protein